jgi:hypothetical protein
LYRGSGPEDRPEGTDTGHCYLHPMDSTALPPGGCAGRSGQAARPSRRVRIGVGLTWAATGVVGVAALVSLILAWRMDDVFTSALAEGRVLPFTGEADEQAVFPALLGFAFVAVTVATGVLGYMLRGWAYHGEHFGTVLLAAALVAVSGLGTPVVLPLSLASQQYTHDLYGWWYVPLLIAVAASYACCLVSAAVGLSGPRELSTAPIGDAVDGDEWRPSNRLGD